MFFNIRNPLQAQMLEDPPLKDNLRRCDVIVFAFN